MALHPGLHVATTPSGTGTMPRDARLALGGLLAPADADTLSVRTGVLFDNGNPVVSGTSGLQLNVRPCRVVSKFSDGNGPTVFAISSTQALTMDPAPGSGARIDVVYALQPLVTGDGGDGGTSVQPVVGIVTGTPSGSPTAKPIPPGAVEIGRGTVLSGMTSTNAVVWSAPRWTVPNGGLVPESTSAALLPGSVARRVPLLTSGTFTIASTWWTPAVGNFLRWQDIGGRVILNGAAQYTPSGGPAAAIPSSGSITIVGPPPPRTAGRGTLISGNAKQHFVELSTGLTFDFKGVSATESGSFIWFDGFSYDRA